MHTLFEGDCLESLKKLPDNSVESCVSDPPYGLGKEPDPIAMLKDWLDTGHHDVTGKGFMGQEWDGFIPQPKVWREVYRVLKPGGYLLAFSGTRTFDLMGLAIRMAGFEIRDRILYLQDGKIEEHWLAWCYGTGFAKNGDISKAMDKNAGAKREVVGRYQPPGMDKPWNLQNANDERNVEVFASSRNNLDITAPATEDAKAWSGWGTCLKPAHEPIIIARKPIEGTVINNVLKWHTGAMNIDACRVEHITVDGGSLATNPHLRTHINGGNGGNIIAHEDERRVVIPNKLGRFPSNLIHDGSEPVLEEFASYGVKKSGTGAIKKKTSKGFKGNAYGEENRPEGTPMLSYGDSGSVSRYFYCAKASSSERDEGLNGKTNNHPTVKPVELMKYLCRLVTPKGGTVLDPYMGSGSTGKGAILEGFNFIGMEREPEFLEIAKARCLHAEKIMAEKDEPGLFDIN
jgi:DNA modification methylase